MQVSIVGDIDQPCNDDSFYKGSGVFQDHLVSRIRYFPTDGSVEFYGYPIAVHRRLADLRSRPRAKRGESLNVEQSQISSAKRARKNVRLRTQSIVADRLLTLTYRENMTDYERLKKDFKAFMRRMKRAGLYHYVAVPEKQTRGAWHIHVAVRGRLVYQLVRSIWLKIVGGKGMGNVDVRNPSTGGKWKRHHLSAYIAKYIGKAFDHHELNKKRYWSSRGIEIPPSRDSHIVFDSPNLAADLHAMVVDCFQAVMTVCPASDITAYVAAGGRYFYISGSPVAS